MTDAKEVEALEASTDMPAPSEPSDEGGSEARPILKPSSDPAMDLSAVFDRKPRILVADDDWLNRDLLQAYLSSSGCEVLTASNGEEALTQALSYAPDLALIDVQMPKMDGLELCRRLKATAATRFVPVVIITALDSEDEKLNAFEVGADDFITKPYSSIVLLARVRSLLRIKRLHDEVESRNELLREVLDRYVAELKRRAPGRGVAKLRHLLALKQSYPAEPFLAAIEQALRYGLFDLTRLERLILERVAGDFFDLDEEP